MFKKLHPIDRDEITFYVEGVAVTAESGESVASILLRQALRWSRTSTVTGSKRAPYCMMGVCFECLAMVDGASRPTCLAKARDGMRIERALRLRVVPL